jgi:hypothetical protein
VTSSQLFLFVGCHIRRTGPTHEEFLTCQPEGDVTKDLDMRGYSFGHANDGQDDQLFVLCGVWRWGPFLAAAAAVGMAATPSAPQISRAHRSGKELRSYHVPFACMRGAASATVLLHALHAMCSSMTCLLGSILTSSYESIGLCMSLVSELPSVLGATFLYPTLGIGFR